MELYLMRHGHAVSESFDPERPLSGIGRAQVERLAAVLKANRVVFDRIWHSAKLRARQTAENLGQALVPGVVPEKKDGLKPNDPAGPLADLMGVTFSENPGLRLLIVSHIPLLPSLISFLTGTDSPGKIPSFPEAGMAFLKPDHSGLWRLQWIADPDMRNLQKIS